VAAFDERSSLCLRDHRGETPFTRDGKKPTPALRSNCLEELRVCALLITARRRGMFGAGGSSAQTYSKRAHVQVYAVTRFAVDRQFMFESLKRVKAWIPIDGTTISGKGAVIARKSGKRGILRIASLAGKCLEVCPAGNEHNQFVGAAIHRQVSLFNMHPTGAMNKSERLQAIIGSRRHSGMPNAAKTAFMLPQKVIP